MNAMRIVVVGEITEFSFKINGRPEQGLIKIRPADCSDQAVAGEFKLTQLPVVDIGRSDVSSNEF